MSNNLEKTDMISNYRVKLNINKLVNVLEQCLNKLCHLMDKRDSEIPQNGFQCEPTSHKTTSPCDEFLESLGIYIEVTRKRMECFPTAETAATQCDKQWREESEDRRKETLELRRKVEAIKRKCEREEEEKKQMIGEYRKAIEMIEVVKKEELNEIARRGHELMNQEWQVVGYELNNLQFEEKMMQRKNEYQFKENLLSEKCLRDEKAKCERKLEEFIALYDRDLRKKQIEYETITQQQQLETEELTRLTELFALQKPKYEQLMQERAIWQEKELAKKLYRLKKMLAHNTISKFLNNYVRALRENNISIVITKKSKGKKKKTVS